MALQIVSQHCGSVRCFSFAVRFISWHRPAVPWPRCVLPFLALPLLCGSQACTAWLCRAIAKLIAAVRGYAIANQIQAMPLLCVI